MLVALRRGGLWFIIFCLSCSAVQAALPDAGVADRAVPGDAPIAGRHTTAGSTRTGVPSRSA